MTVVCSKQMYIYIYIYMCVCVCVGGCVCMYCAVLKRLATPSDFHTPLPSIVPFAHSETYFSHGYISHTSCFFAENLIFLFLQVSS
jgi:hypothetical protein